MRVFIVILSFVATGTAYCQDSLMISHKLTSLSDTLLDKTKEKQQQLDSINRRVRYQQERLDSMRLATNAKLSKINQELSGKAYLTSTDSVLRSFQQQLSSRYKHDSIDGQIRKHVAVVDSMISVKRRQLDSLSGLFGVNLDTKIKNVDLSVPGMPVATDNIKFSPDLGSLSKMSLQTKLPDFSSVSGVKLPDSKLPSVLKSNPVSDRVGDIKKLNQKFNGLKSLSDSTISIDTVAFLAEQYAQQQIKNNKLIGGLTADQQKMLAEKQKLEELIQSLQPNEIEQEARKKIEKFVMGHEEKFKNDLEDVGKLQLKYRNVADMRLLPKRPPNEMKGKPFIERLIPALTFQAYIKNGSAIDVAPSLGYRFSGRIRSGVGLYQRIFISPTFSQTSIKGMRAFGEFRFWGTKYVHIEAEHSNVGPVNPMANEGNAGFINRLNFGLYYSYRISKHINGHSLLLYDLKQLKHFPNTSHSSIRFGIDIQMFKRPKKSNEAK